MQNGRGAMCAARWLCIAFFIFLVTLVLTCNPAYSSLLGINILSQSHHIWGFAGQQTADGPLETYDLSDTQPISHTATGYEFYEDPWPPEVQTSFASAGNFIHELAINRQLAGAWAESFYNFTADYNVLAFNAFGYTNQSHLQDKLIVSLLDTTENVNIFYYISSTQYDFINRLVVDDIFNINKEHVYQLHLYSEVTSGDSGAWALLQANLSCPLQPIPEPNSMALLGIGIAGLIAVGMRKKRC